MVIPGSHFTATSSLYWLLQNGAIAIYAIADPLIVAGQGASVRRYVYIYTKKRKRANGKARMKKFKIE